MRRWTAAAACAATLGLGARAEAIQIELGTLNFVDPLADTKVGAGLVNDFHFGGPLSFVYGFHFAFDKNHLVSDLELGPLLVIGDRGIAPRVGATLLLLFANGFDDNPGFILGGGKAIAGIAWVFDNGRSVFVDAEPWYAAMLDGPEGDERSRFGLNAWLGFAF
jgi:hypothetical protein